MELVRIRYRLSLLRGSSGMKRGWSSLGCGEKVGYLRKLRERKVAFSRSVVVRKDNTCDLYPRLWAFCGENYKYGCVACFFQLHAEACHSFIYHSWLCFGDQQQPFYFHYILS